LAALKTDGPITGNITRSCAIFASSEYSYHDYCRIARSISNKNPSRHVETLTVDYEDANGDDARRQVAGDTFIHSIVLYSHVHDRQVAYVLKCSRRRRKSTKHLNTVDAPYLIPPVTSASFKKP